MWDENVLSVFHGGTVFPHEWDKVYEDETVNNASGWEKLIGQDEAGIVPDRGKTNPGVTGGWKHWVWGKEEELEQSRIVKWDDLNSKKRYETHSNYVAQQITRHFAYECNNTQSCSNPDFLF